MDPHAASSGGTYTTIATPATPAPTTTGHLIALRLAASSIKAFVDGVEVCSVTDTVSQTISRHGLWTNTTTAAFDNFRHTPLA